MHKTRNKTSSFYNMYLSLHYDLTISNASYCSHNGVSMTSQFISLQCKRFKNAGVSPVPPGECISSCVGVADGHYQSCHGCDVYASCGGGVLYDNRPCPAGHFWEDYLKHCLQTSETCSQDVPGK